MTAELNSIEEYERHLQNVLEAWSPERRLALAAGMAERWLPAYEAFSQREHWGDPKCLRRILDAVWRHALGRRLSPTDISRYGGQILDVTPHLDDFDAEDAIAACVVLDDALACCETTDNVAWAVQALLSGFEAVTPGALDQEEQLRLWKESGIRKEVRRQLKLIDEIAAAPWLEETMIDQLRARLRTAAFAGESSRTSPACASTELTNQAAFEQYRAMVELDLKGKRADPLVCGESPSVAGMMLMGEWLGRYSRRRSVLDGSYGRLADQLGIRAVLARQRTLDAREKMAPDWDRDLRMMIDLCYQNATAGLDARAVDAPHAYGPSLRRLWVQARQSGKSNAQAWQQVVAWARHRPAAWESENARKKRGLAHAAPSLGEQLAREVAWFAIHDAEHPWTAELDGQQWQVRINDFPDDLMYTLIIDRRVVGDFHDWPQAWRRE
jgi:uncharacterized protein YjaG (DUF416 family)